MKEPQACIWAFDDDDETLKPIEFYYSEKQDGPLSNEALKFATKLKAKNVLRYHFTVPTQPHISERIFLLFMSKMTSSETPYLNPEDIFAAVSELGIRGTTPSLDEEFSGGQCHVYKLSFQDQESLAVRMPLHMSFNRPDDIIRALSAEQRTLQTLEMKGFRCAPRCRGSSLTFDNPIKFPFILLTWADGSILRWCDDSPSRDLRDNLLGQIATIQLSLIKCTLEKSM